MTVNHAKNDQDLSDDTVCVWAQTGDEWEMDVSTKCGEVMFEYEGDVMHWELKDGDLCPFCGRPIRREWGWIA